MSKKKKKVKTQKKKKPKGKTTKQKVYERFVKVKPKKAKDYAEQWWKETGKKVKLSTIKTWISVWKRGQGLPKGAKKKG